MKRILNFKTTYSVTRNGAKVTVELLGAKDYKSIQKAAVHINADIMVPKVYPSTVDLTEFVDRQDEDKHWARLQAQLDCLLKYCKEYELAHFQKEIGFHINSRADGVWNSGKKDWMVWTLLNGHYRDRFNLPSDETRRARVLRAAGFAV